MANEQNLKLLNTRTMSEQRKITKLGVQKSGEARRKNKRERDNITALLSMKITDEQTIDELTQFGVDGADLNVEMLIVYKLVQLALDGDLNAIKYIDERIGNNPQLKIKREELKLKRELLKNKLSGNEIDRVENVVIKINRNNE